MGSHPASVDVPAKRQRPDLPLLLKTWLAVTALMPGLLRFLAQRAHARQGGDASRLSERFGVPTQDRPEGPLVWVHAASVGEVVSVVVLSRRIRERTGAQLLITTSTLGGGEAVAKRLPGALHQFLPIDTPVAVDGFISHWRPDVAIFVEGDLWPRLLIGLSARHTPTALVNARASRSRTRFPRVFGALLSQMRTITTQDDDVARGLIALGLDPDRVSSPGNLKAEVDLPPDNLDLRSAITIASDDRALWAAVSTHQGEDEIVLDAHVSLPDYPLLLLVPRHPERGDALVSLLAERRIAYTRQSAGELPTCETRVHLIDVLGETGAVYASAGLVLVGGSLLPGPGGHTPYEPAALGCAIAYGPHVENFSAAYEALRATGGAREIQPLETFQSVLRELLDDHDALTSMQQAARAEYQSQSGAVDRTLALLDDILPSRLMDACSSD